MPTNAPTYDVTFLLLNHARQEGLQGPETSQSIDIECPVGGVRKGCW